MKKIILFISILSLSIHTIAQSTPAVTNNKGKISSYYSVKDIILMGGPVIESNRIVLYTKGQDVIGYYGWASQGSQEEYILGKINGNIITGIKYSLFDSSSSSIKLTVLPKAITTLSPVGKVTIPSSKADLFVGKINSIYENPDVNSRVLEKDIDLEKRGFAIIEIGKMEKNNDQYNIWYKIKNGNIEGWVFGLLYVF